MSFESKKVLIFVSFEDPIVNVISTESNLSFTGIFATLPLLPEVEGSDLFVSDAWRSGTWGKVSK